MRGPESIAATKLKAHQSEEEILRLTLVQQENAGGNDNADHVAKQAILEHHELLREYLEFTQQRLVAYRDLMATIQALFIRTTEATIANYHAHCKVDPAATAPITRSIRQRKRLLLPLKYADEEHTGHSFLLDRHRKKPNQWILHTGFFNDLFRFWAELKSTKHTEDTSGMTWIELLILFEIRTGNRTHSDITKPRFTLHPLDRPPPIFEYLRSFKTATLKILTLTSGNPEVKEIVQTEQITGKRLRCIGTISNCASTGFNTTVGLSEAKLIAKSLLAIIGKTNDDELSQLYNGRLWKTLRAISF